MNEAKHTPTPWAIEPHGNTTAVYSGRDNQHHGLRLLNLDDGDSNFDANAAFIVTAVNAHESLLAACKAFLAAADAPELNAGEYGRAALMSRQAIALAEKQS